MNQIINMVLRIFMRKIVSKGIDAGLERAARAGRGATHPKPGPSAPPPGHSATQAKQAMRALRRTSRF